jgi:acylglycerol lipase
MRDMASATGSLAARDGTTLHLRRWRPSDDPWAMVVVVHGLAEHSGGYETVGSWMADAGLDVTGYDLRGFGASGGRRAYVDRWPQHHDDLEDVLKLVRSTSDGRPVALFGHSLGGLIVLGYVTAEPQRPAPDALIVSAPALDSSVPGWKRIVVRLLGSVAPTIAVKNDLDGALLSRDPAVGERYLLDPLNRHATTTRFGAEALAEQARVRAALGRVAVPTLVYHGEADRLVPIAASAPLGALPVVTRRTHPGLRHESHNEPEGRDVVADAVSWLRTTVAPSSG